MTYSDDCGETMSNSPNIHYPILFVLAIVYAAIPWILYGVEWPVLMGFVCGVIAAKWFMFGVMDWVKHQ